MLDPGVSVHQSQPAEIESPRASTLADLFFSQGDRRLRAAWRLAIQSLLLLVLTILLLVLFFWVGTSLGIRAGIPLLLEIQASTTLGVTLSIYLARRWLDRRSFVSLGLEADRRGLNDFLFGVALLGALAAGEALVGWSLGWFSFETPAWRVQSPSSVFTAILASLLALATVAWTEELLFRGYYLQNISQGWSLTSAVILTALLFPLVHPNLTVLDYLHLVLAGLLLAYAYVRTRRLWLPIGLHLGWNFVGVSVFGVAGSLPFDIGLGPLFPHTSHAPLVGGLVSGSSLAAFLVLGLAAVSVFLYTRNREA